MEADPTITEQIEALKEAQDAFYSKLISLSNQSSRFGEALQNAHLIRQCSSSAGTPADWQFAEQILQIHTAVEVRVLQNVWKARCILFSCLDRVGVHTLTESRIRNLQYRDQEKSYMRTSTPLR